MTCLHKYWLKEFAKFFSIIQLVILVLFVFIDYLSRMERFLNSDITLVGALGYVLLKVPFMFVQLTPASILLTTITVFGLMNRNNELLAIRSSGVSIYFLVKPAILVSVMLAALMFFFGGNPYSGFHGQGKLFKVSGDKKKTQYVLCKKRYLDKV